MKHYRTKKAKRWSGRSPEFGVIRTKAINALKQEPLLRFCLAEKFHRSPAIAHRITMATNKEFNWEYVQRGAHIAAIISTVILWGGSFWSWARDLDPSLWYFGALICSGITLLLVQRKWITEQLNNRFESILQLFVGHSERIKALEEQFSALDQKWYKVQSRFAEIELSRNQENLKSFTKTSGQYLRNSYVLTMLIAHLEQLPEFQRTGWNKEEVEAEVNKILKEDFGWKEGSDETEG